MPSSDPRAAFGPFRSDGAVPVRALALGFGASSSVIHAVDAGAPGI